MKTLLCSAPNGTLDTTIKPLENEIFLFPHALLRILSWMEENDYSADIYDINQIQ
jgi:hypothetical protein